VTAAAVGFAPGQILEIGEHRLERAGAVQLLETGAKRPQPFVVDDQA
jgi:hypothetical protein